jgi:Protein of unknown function (DUF4058)
MKSPFPGMDPYIEVCGLWEDFHHSLIAEIGNALAQAIPERYLVRTGERPYVVLAEGEGKRSHPFLPDVRVTSVASPETPSTTEGGTALAEAATETAAESGPVSMRAFIEEEYREAFIEIYETDPEERLVTCLEVLSPSNKRYGSTGWDLYLRKRQGLLLYKANLVEIDLVRGGQRMPMIDPWPNAPYTLLVARKHQAPFCQVWPAHFRRPLPTIPVPLAKPDPDIQLNLQPMIDTIYTRFRYHRRINYSRPLTPPLGPDETTWLSEQLQTQSRQA